MAKNKTDSPNTESATEMLNRMEAAYKDDLAKGIVPVFKDEFAKRIRQAAVDILAEQRDEEIIIRNKLGTTITQNTEKGD